MENNPEGVIAGPRQAMEIPLSNVVFPEPFRPTTRFMFTSFGRVPLAGFGWSGWRKSIFVRLNVRKSRIAIESIYMAAFQRTEISVEAIMLTSDAPDGPSPSCARPRTRRGRDHRDPCQRLSPAPRTTGVSNCDGKDLPRRIVEDPGAQCSHCRSATCTPGRAEEAAAMQSWPPL